MIGIFKPGKIDNPNARKLYHSVYCALCYTLRTRYGIFYSLFISHEIIHLIVANLRYTTSEVCLVRCVNCFKKKQQIISNTSLVKAADCCLLLVWLKLVDAKKDKEHLLYRSFINVITPKVKTVSSLLSPKLRAKVNEYVSAIEQDLDYLQIVDLTSILASLIFEEITADSKINQDTMHDLSMVGEGYGRIISLADPILDYDDDIKKKKDNPILRSSMKDYMVRLNNAIESTEAIIRQLAEEGKITKYFYTFYALAVHRLQCKISKKRI